MQDLNIHASRPCRTCDSQGVLIHPIWHAFWRQLQDWQQENPEPKSYPTNPRANPDWVTWQERRADVKLEIWAELGYVEEPNEEDACPTCKGTGREAVELSLPELAQLLGLKGG